MKKSGNLESDYEVQRKITPTSIYERKCYSCNGKIQHWEGEMPCVYWKDVFTAEYENFGTVYLKKKWGERNPSLPKKGKSKPSNYGIVIDLSTEDYCNSDNYKYILRMESDIAVDILIDGISIKIVIDSGANVHLQDRDV